MWSFKPCGTLWLFFPIQKKWEKEIQKEKEFKLGFTNRRYKREGLFWKTYKKTTMAVFLLFQILWCKEFGECFSRKEKIVKFYSKNTIIQNSGLKNDAFLIGK
jgi:hypothetical protein